MKEQRDGIVSEAGIGLAQQLLHHARNAAVPSADVAGLELLNRLDGSNPVVQWCLVALAIFLVARLVLGLIERATRLYHSHVDWGNTRPLRTSSVAGDVSVADPTGQDQPSYSPKLP